MTTHTEADELTLSRLYKEDDAHFFAREVRQKVTHFLEASANLEVGKLHGNNTETIYKLAAAYRHARFMLKGATESLNAALNEKTYG